MPHNWFDQFSILDDEICCQYLDVKTALLMSIAWLNLCDIIDDFLPLLGPSVSVLQHLSPAGCGDALFLSWARCGVPTLQMQERYWHDHRLPACLFNSVVGALSPVQSLRQLSGCPAQRRATQEIRRYLV